MTKGLSAEAVFAVVKSKGPIKATGIARYLTKVLKRPVTRSDVNLLLHNALKGQVENIGGDRGWALVKDKRVIHDRSARKKTVKKVSSKAKPRRSPGQRRFAPTSVQTALIQSKPSGNLLIRGEAGSGKTSVLAARASWIASEAESESLLFLTYNQGLVAYVERLLATLGASERVTVSTFRAWARSVAADLGLKIDAWTLSHRRAELLPEILEGLRGRWGEHRVLGLPLSFWHEEVAWIGGQGVSRREDYRAIARAGRGQGIPIRGEDRDVVWDVYEAYCSRVQSERSWDADAPGALVLAAVSRRGGTVPEAVRFDHVLVDEVQDFEKGWLQAIAPMARTSLTLAGDLAQRIYKRRYTWEDAGISLPPARSRRLGESFRTTQQIMSVAVHLATNPDLQQDADYLAPAIPERTGPPVRRVTRAEFGGLVDAVVPLIAETLKEHPNDRVAVVLPTWRHASTIVKALRAVGVPARSVRGEAFGRSYAGVQVTTCHQTKGLEWDHVFLLDLGDSSVPGAYLDSIADPADQAEESNLLRRLIYVAMTRARKSLVLGGTSPFCRFFDAVPAEHIVDVP